MPNFLGPQPLIDWAPGSGPGGGGSFGSYPFLGGDDASGGVFSQGWGRVGTGGRFGAYEREFWRDMWDRQRSVVGPKYDPAIHGQLASLFASFFAPTSSRRRNPFFYF